MAYHFKNRQVGLFGAADTFRCCGKQLVIWGEQKVGAILNKEGETDPASVATLYDTLKFAVANNADVVNY